MDTPEPVWPPGASPERFFANLACLGGPETPLVERLCWPASGKHVGTDADGALTYSRHQSTYRFEVDGETADGLIDQALERAEGRALCVIGIGAGELVRRALDRGLVVIAWDRDPWLFRLALGRVDFQADLRAGRLRLALGCDLIRLAARNLEPLVHPFLGGLYSTEQRLLEHGAGPRRALICDGGLYVESLTAALEDEGWCSWPCDVEHLSSEEIEYTARTVAPELIASINDRDGLVEFARTHDARLLIWEIDPTTSRPGRVHGSTEHVRFFTYRKHNVEAHRIGGHSNVAYLPLAADTKLRFRPELTSEEEAGFKAPVSFVGSSMVANAERCRATFESLFDRWRLTQSMTAETGRSVASSILEAQRGDDSSCRVAEFLQASAPGFAGWCAAVDAEDPITLLGEAAASDRRLRWIRSLGDRGLHVWGDEGWRHASDAGVTYRGLAKHRHDLNRIYASSTINLDLGRLYQTDIVTLRVFDVLACGGFALVEHSEALEELLDIGTEVESYRSQAELLEKVDHYLAHPEEARAIAERGCAAVRERHAFGDRVRTMLASFERTGEAPVQPSES